MAIFFVNWCLKFFIENITEERLYLDRFNRFLKAIYNKLDLSVSASLSYQEDGEIQVQ